MKMLTLMIAAAMWLAAQQPAPSPKQARKGNPPAEAAGDDVRGYNDTPQLPGQKWKVHDMEEPKWKVENGYIEIVPRTGKLVTKDKFGDCQLHVEWMVPKGVKGQGQGRGNSGVELMTRYEIQVLESHDNLTYADGAAGAIYG